MWTTEPVDALLTCARRILHVREVVPVSDQPTRANERANTDAVSITYPARPALGPGPRLWDPTFLTLRAHPWKRVIARGPLVIEHFVLCRLFYRITESARPNHRISQTCQTISRQFTLRSLASMQAWVARGACKSPATSGLTVLLSRLSAAGIVGAAEGCLAAGAADLSQWNRELFGTSALPSLLRGTASWLCRQADSVPRGTDGCLRHLSPLLLRSWSSAAVVST